MLHEGGEREGRRVDRRRQRVLPQETGKGNLDVGIGVADVDASNAVDHRPGKTFTFPS